MKDQVDIDSILSSRKCCSYSLNLEQYLFFLRDSLYFIPCPVTAHLFRGSEDRQVSWLIPEGGRLLFYVRTVPVTCGFYACFTATAHHNLQAFTTKEGFLRYSFFASTHSHGYLVKVYEKILSSGLGIICFWDYQRF